MYMLTTVSLLTSLHRKVQADQERRPSAGDVLASFEEFSYTTGSSPSSAATQIGTKRTVLNYADPVADMLRISTHRNVELEAENAQLRAELAAFKQAQGGASAAVPAATT